MRLQVVTFLAVSLCSAAAARAPAASPRSSKSPLTVERSEITIGCGRRRTFAKVDVTFGKKVLGNGSCNINREILLYKLEYNKPFNKCVVENKETLCYIGQQYHVI